MLLKALVAAVIVSCNHAGFLDSLQPCTNRHEHVSRQHLGQHSGTSTQLSFFKPKEVHKLQKQDRVPNLEVWLG